MTAVEQSDSRLRDHDDRQPADGPFSVETVSTWEVRVTGERGEVILNVIDLMDWKRDTAHWKAQAALLMQSAHVYTADGARFLEAAIGKAPKHPWHAQLAAIGYSVDPCCDPPGQG